MYHLSVSVDITITPVGDHFRSDTDPSVDPAATLELTFTFNQTTVTLPMSKSEIHDHVPVLLMRGSSVIRHRLNYTEVAYLYINH